MNIEAVAFNKDGSNLVGGGTDAMIHIWNLKQLKEINTLKGHKK